MRNLRRALGAFAAVALVALLTLGPADAKSSIACGLVVDSNTTLHHDYDFSGGLGICIFTDNVKLNLGGHTIQGGSGSYNEPGIIVEANNVDISNGTVANFYEDVDIPDASSNVSVHNLKLVTDGDWDYYGVFAYGGSGINVKSVSCKFAYACVGFDGPDVGEGLSNSSVSNVTDTGSEYAVFDDYGTNNTFTKNSMTGPEYGFYTYFAAADTFSKNTVKNAYIGFYDDENSMGVVYSDNKALNGDYGFYLYGNDDDDSAPQGGYSLVHNTASGNESTGFYTEYGFYYGCLCASDPGSSFIQNTATNNGGDGFYDYWSINSTWSGNKASGNGDSGFELQYPQNDVITGNVAKNNGSKGIWLEDNNPSSYNAQSFSNNQARGNQDYGLYGDYPQSGSGNFAKNNLPFDCWNISCQAGATLATVPERPLSAGAPVKRPHVGTRPQAHHS